MAEATKGQIKTAVFAPPVHSTHHQVNSIKPAKVLPRMNLAAAARLAMLKEKNKAAKLAAVEKRFAKPSPSKENGNKPRRILTNKRLSLSNKNRTFKCRRSPKILVAKGVRGGAVRKIEPKQDSTQAGIFTFSFGDPKNIEPSVLNVATSELNNFEKEICEWCLVNSQNVDDLKSFFAHVKQTATDGLSKSAIPRRFNLPSNGNHDFSVDKLEALIKRENFPPSLMRKFLQELMEKYSFLKEHASVWHLIVFCQIKECDYQAAKQSLETAYQLKSKPPSRIIEAHQLLLNYLVKLIPSQPTNDLSTIDDNNKQQQQCVSTIYLPVSAQKVKRSVSDGGGDAIDPIGQQYEDGATVAVVPPFVTSDEQNSMTPDTDQTVRYRGGDMAYRSCESPPTSSSSEFSSGKWSLHDCASVDSKASIYTDNIFELPKCCQAHHRQQMMFKEEEEEDVGSEIAVSACKCDRVRSSTARPLSDIKKSNVFLSAQKKFALLSAKRQSVVTPVRRSTRVDQERLPENLREKLHIFDSPSELMGNEQAGDFVFTKNPVLSDSFGKFDKSGGAGGDSPN